MDTYSAPGGRLQVNRRRLTLSQIRRAYRRGAGANPMKVPPCRASTIRASCRRQLRRWLSFRGPSWRRPVSTNRSVGQPLPLDALRGQFGAGNVIHSPHVPVGVTEWCWGTEQTSAAILDCVRSTATVQLKCEFEARRRRPGEPKIMIRDLPPVPPFIALGVELGVETPNVCK